MNTKIEKLRAMGCDIDGAMERFLDDEELYLMCLDKLIDDENYEKLENALNAGDIKAAFDCAHTLKGVFANMGITPMYDEVVKVVEPLRAGNGDNLLGYCENIEKIREELRKL